MIDVIAQGGRYPPNANSLAGFFVEGEQHYWVHVAIVYNLDLLFDHLAGKPIESSPKFPGQFIIRLRSLGTPRAKPPF
jgi:hypothetical protein